MSHRGARGASTLVSLGDPSRHTQGVLLSDPQRPGATPSPPPAVLEAASRASPTLGRSRWRAHGHRPGAGLGHGRGSPARLQFGGTEPTAGAYVTTRRLYPRSRAGHPQDLPSHNRRTDGARGLVRPGARPACAYAGRPRIAPSVRGDTHTRQPAPDIRRCVVARRCRCGRERHTRCSSASQAVGSQSGPYGASRSDVGAACVSRAARQPRGSQMAGRAAHRGSTRAVGLSLTWRNRGPRRRHLQAHLDRLA